MSGRRSKQTRESGSTDAGAPPIPPKPANRKLLFAGGAVLVGLLFAFIVIEVSLLIAGQPQFLKPHEDVPQFEPLYEDAPFPVYTNTPSNRIVFKYGSNPRGYFGAENEVVHSTNAQGFRGKEFSGEKRPGVTRIAFLGDSVAFGEGVRDSDTCPEQTVAMLNKQSGANGKQYESLNFGVGGYNTQLAHFAFMRFVRPTQPDIVVLIYSLNDAEPPMFIYNAQTGEVERRRLCTIHGRPVRMHCAQSGSLARQVLRRCPQAAER